MNNLQNWQSGVIPVQSEALLFPYLSGTNTVINDLSPNPFTLGPVDFDGIYQFSGNGFIVNNGSPFTVHTYSQITMSNALSITNGFVIDLNHSSLTLSGILSGGALTAQAEETSSLTLSGNNALWNGSISTISTMTLAAGHANAFGTISSLTVGANTTLTLEANTSFTLAAATLLASSGSSTLLINPNSHTITMDASVSLNGGSFSMIGSGTILLNSSGNSFSSTNINAGTLQIGSTSALGSTATVSVGNGATLNFQNFANTIQSLTNNGTVQTKVSTTATSGYTQSAGNLTLDISNAMGSVYGKIIATTGGISLNSNPTLTITNSGGFAPVPGDSLVLLTGASRTGRFSSPITQPFSGASLSYSPTDISLNFHQCDASWNHLTSGNWGDSMSAPNWNPSCAPGVDNVASDLDVATFPTITGANSSIVVTLANAAGSASQSVTLFGLVFDSSLSSYTIQRFSGAGSITLATSSGGAMPYIDVLAGNHTINAPIALSNNSRISLSSGGQLTLGANAPMTGAKQLLIHEDEGAGTLINQASISITSFVIQGASLQNLSGGQIYGTSSFSILNGTVYNDASSRLGIATAPIVLSGGTLETAGPVLASQFTQSGSSNLQIDTLGLVSSGHLVQINGSTVLGGTLTVHALPGFSLAIGQTTDLITASGLVTYNGQQNIFSGFAGSVIPHVFYLDHAVQLRLYPTLERHSGASVQILHRLVDQHNIRIERKCLQLRDRFPSQKEFLFAENALFNPSEEKQEILSEKLQQALPFHPWSVYLGPIGGFGDVQTKRNQPGFTHDSIGGMLGFDYVLSTPHRPFNFGFGSVVTYKKVQGNGKDHWGHFASDVIHGSIYGTLVPLHLTELAYDGILGFGYHWDTLRRYTGILSEDIAVGSPQGRILDCLFAIEYAFSHNTYPKMPLYLRIVPLANIQYLQIHNQSYQESGANTFNLQISSQSANSLTTFFGLRMTYLYERTNYSLLTEFDSGWQHEYLDQNHDLHVTAFNVTQVPTTVTIIGAGSNSALLGIDFLSTIQDIWQIEASVDYQLNSLFYDLSFFLSFGAQF